MSLPLSGRTGASTSQPHAAALFRRAASFIPGGVAILSNGEVAMTVSSLQCVSFEPPMVALALATDSIKAAAILSSNRFSARLLRHSEENLARGEELPSDPGLLEMDCTVTATYSAGDHHLVLARVEQTSTSPGFPLVYWRRGLYPFRPQHGFLASRDAFQRFVKAWETGTLPKAQWSHAAHVAIGAFFAVQCPDTAFARTKGGIIRYNEAVGTENSEKSGYHETLTRLWSIVLAKVTQGFSDPWEAACSAVEKLGENRDLHCLYYSFDVVRDAAARRVWVPPDLEDPY